MNLKHFGDSYDIVKRSLLEWLTPFGPWAIHPMFTHDTSDDEADAFSRFLGIPLVSREVLRTGCDREQYFALCARCHNLFLDPDTGFRLAAIKGHREPQYLFGDDLVGLAEARPRALTLIFDQSLARGRERVQIHSKLAHLATRDLHGFGYVSQASFIILGQSATLVEEARKQLVTASRLPLARIVQCRAI